MKTLHLHVEYWHTSHLIKSINLKLPQMYFPYRFSKNAKSKVLMDSKPPQVLCVSQFWSAQLKTTTKSKCVFQTRGEKMEKKM